MRDCMTVGDGWERVERVVDSKEDRRVRGMVEAILSVGNQRSGIKSSRRFVGSWKTWRIHGTWPAGTGPCGRKTKRGEVGKGNPLRSCSLQAAQSLCRELRVLELGRS